MTPADARIEKLIATKVRIVAAAKEAVALGGWEAAQIALVAQRAGVAVGSIYRYFDSKAALYADVLGTVSQREVDVVRAIVESDGTAGQRLVDAIQVFTSRAMKGRRLAYALIAEPCDAEIDRARLAYRSALADHIARLVSEGVATGEFIDVDPRIAASCLTGAFMEALVGPLAPEAEPDSARSRAIANAIAHLAARMLFRQAEPALPSITRENP